MTTATKCFISLLVTLCMFATGCGGSQATPPDLGTVLVSLDEARQVTDVPALQASTELPTDRPRPDPESPAACRAVFDQEVAYGADVGEFRTETYSALADTKPGHAAAVAVVVQAVGLYADSVRSRGVFDRLMPVFEACAAEKIQYYDFDVTRPDTSTVALASEQWQVRSRLVGPTIVSVAVSGLPDGRRVADELLEITNGQL